MYEPDLIDNAKALMDKAKQRDAAIPVPVDVVCAEQLKPGAATNIRNSTDIKKDDMVLDIGPETAEHYANIIKEAGTIVWNGPVGVF